MWPMNQWCYSQGASLHYNFHAFCYAPAQLVFHRITNTRGHAFEPEPNEFDKFCARIEVVLFLGAGSKNGMFFRVYTKGVIKNSHREGGCRILWWHKQLMPATLRHMPRQGVAISLYFGTPDVRKTSANYAPNRYLLGLSPRINDRSKGITARPICPPPGHAYASYQTDGGFVISVFMKTLCIPDRFVVDQHL